MTSGTFAVHSKPKRNAICFLLTASLALPAFGVARADVIATEKVANSTLHTDRGSVLTSPRHSDFEYHLRSLGVVRESAEMQAAAITGEAVPAPVGKLDALYTLAQYVPPPVGAGGVAGLIGGYSGGGYTTMLAIGVAAILYWKPVQTNTNNLDYMVSKPAPMDPSRKISEQDCTKPIVFDGGNLRCK
jgi:hypothetical protein